MGSLLTENVVCCAKDEVTYGTDSVPTAADAIVTTGIKFTPFESNTVNRNLDRPMSGSNQELHWGIRGMVEFKCELVGSGTLGTPPGFGKLIRACRWREISNGLISVRYTPYRPSLDSLTIYFWMDGQRHKLLGCRGTFTIEFDSENIPYISFKFTGIYVAPGSSAAPDPLTGWDDFEIPEVVEFDSTPVPTLHGYAGVFRSFKFDAGSEVVYFNNPGEKEVRVTKHACKGNISILAPPLSTKDYFASAKANTLGPLKIEHGTVASRRVFLEAVGNTAQLIKPNYGDHQGRVLIDSSLSFIPTVAQHDEFEIRFAAA